MKISVKSRYALASLIYMVQQQDANRCIPILSISDALGFSKIYLEQVFSLLKRAGLVSAEKGAQGGYRLARPPEQITVYDVLNAIEHSLFDRTQVTVSHEQAALEQTLQACVFGLLDRVVIENLNEINIQYLANQVSQMQQQDNFMFYI